MGIDRLSETGASIDVGLPNYDKGRYGPNKTSDDLDQLYFSIELDDTKLQNRVVSHARWEFILRMYLVLKKLAKAMINVRLRPMLNLRFIYRALCWWL